MFDYDPASKRAADKLDEYDLSELLLQCYDVGWVDPWDIRERAILVKYPELADVLDAHGDGGRDADLGPVGADVEAGLGAAEVHGAEGGVVVGPGAADEDEHGAVEDGLAELADGVVEALERARDVGVVGDAAAEEEDAAGAAAGDGGGGLEEHGAAELVRLVLGGVARVLAVVGELVAHAVRDDRVRVDHRGARA